MVAWGGIEPPTQGFSTHVAPKKSMFMGLAAGFRATCYITCDSKTTENCDTFFTLTRLNFSVQQRYLSYAE